MASYDEIFGKPKGGGGGGSGVGATKRREEARERQAEQEQQAHDQELAKQEPVKETVADEKDVVLSNPRWSVERAFFTQKVKASVDVAIPKSRGDVSKVTFTVFAILPNGKRSKQIGTAEGHPDSNGTITVDVVLHYPDANERVIVKPVESYQYLFTAKHKYSKEITGPYLVVVDHQVSRVNFYPENIKLELPQGIGDLHGTIFEVHGTYVNDEKVPTPGGGVNISLEFRNRSQLNREKFKDYKWKQFIHTNSPRAGRGNDYEDVLQSEILKNKDGHEYWFGDGQDRSFQVEMNNITDGDYFSDVPGRDCRPGNDVIWHAKLYLYGIEKSGGSRKLAGLEYGFTVTPEQEVIIFYPKVLKKLN